MTISNSADKGLGMQGCQSHLRRWQEQLLIHWYEPLHNGVSDPNPRCFQVQASLPSRLADKLIQPYLRLHR